MLSKYPIALLTNAVSEEQLNDEISILKSLYDSGLRWDIFQSLLKNAHNGTTIFQRNSFTVNGWIEHFKKELPEINITEAQISLFLDYNDKFKECINEQDGIYTLRKSPQLEDFGFVYLVFKILKV